jgi:anaerobic selenocysteine-containing dehydrogenase
MGVREDEYFQTAGRNVPQLRRRRPEPQAYLHPEDAEALGVGEGDPVWIEVRHGAIELVAAIRPDMPPGVVRAPHGWWKPEEPRGRESLSGAWRHADGLLCADDDDFLDREQGIPHLKGVPCRIIRIETGRRQSRHGAAWTTA